MNPEGERVWIKFHVLEIGLHSNGRQQLPCRDEYVRLVWGADHSSSVILCGSYNLSRETLQWISDGNRLSVQLVSVNGKQGRGFHASYRFGRFFFFLLLLQKKFINFGQADDGLDCLLLRSSAGAYYDERHDLSGHDGGGGRGRPKRVAVSSV